MRAPIKLTPHDYPYHWVILDPKSKQDKVKVTNLKISPKFQIFLFRNTHYTRHTFWSCLIRCANMKWIRWVLLKIQSGHDSVHRRTDGRTDGRTDRRTDGQGDTSIPPYQLRWSGGYKKWGHPLSWLVVGNINCTPVYNDSNQLTSSLTEIETNTLITNQHKESKEKT